MTTTEALAFLEGIVVNHPMPLAGHAKAAEAVRVLKAAIAEKTPETPADVTTDA